MFHDGERKAEVLKDETRRVLASKGGVEVEYINVCDPETLVDVEHIDTRALIAVAVRVGKTRLIDNRILAEPQQVEEQDEEEDSLRLQAL